MNDKWRATATISVASLADAEAILTLQKLAFRSEAELYNDWSLAPLMQSIESLREEFGRSTVLKATVGGRLVGSVRARQNAETCSIGSLIVHPEFRRQGIGSQLLRDVEARFKGASRFELFTGHRSEANLRLYQRHGYAITRTQPRSETVTLVFLEKRAKGVL